MSIDGLSVDGFAARLSRLGLAPATVEKYRAGVVDFARYLDGRDPRFANVEEYLDQLQVRPATARLRIAALRRFYLYLDSLGRMVDDDGRELRLPTDRVERPRVARNRNDYLSAEEDAALRAAVLDPREDVVVSLMRWAGLRVGEACALRWDDVDLARGTLFVRESKTEAGVRRVPILPELATSLSRWRAYIEARGLYAVHGPMLVTGAAQI